MKKMKKIFFSLTELMKAKEPPRNQQNLKGVSQHWECFEAVCSYIQYRWIMFCHMTETER